MTAEDKPDLLVVCHAAPFLLTDLAADYRLHNLFLAEDKEALLADVGGRIRAILAGGMQGPDATLIARLPKLEIIASNSVGFDATDVAAANARGVVVTHTPDVLTDDVADLGMAFIIMAPRRIAESERYLRARKWRQGRMDLGVNLRGKKLGILGLGRVGSALAKRAQGFGLEIGFFDIAPKNDAAYPVYGSLLEMAADCDILFVSCQGGPSTRKLVDGAVLDALGRDGFLVNVARGTIVDQPALVAALREKRIAGAAIDVFEDEPGVPDALKRLDNVVLSPHVAGFTPEAFRAGFELLRDNVRAHFAGRDLPTPVP